jgi:hypothetical protein
VGASIITRLTQQYSDQVQGSVLRAVVACSIKLSRWRGLYIPLKVDIEVELHPDCHQISGPTWRHPYSAGPPTGLTC